MNIRNSLGLLLSAALVSSPLVAIAAVADAAPAGSRDRTPVCRYEDGSGQARCVWDARHNGNGAGRSYVATGADTRFVSHKRAHWLATTAN